MPKPVTALGSASSTSGLLIVLGLTIKLGAGVAGLDAGQDLEVVLHRCPDPRCAFGGCACPAFPQARCSTPAPAWRLRLTMAPDHATALGRIAGV